MNNVLGIIGQGFVGSAVREGLKNFYQIETFDIDSSKESTCNSIDELVDKTTSMIFICLPTPMKKSGKCDTSIVYKTVADLSSSCKRTGRRLIVILKSTVPPGTVATLNTDFYNVDVVFNPEFLTEANSYDDFKNQSRIIIGGPRPASTKVKTMYRKAFSDVPIVKTDSSHAEMVKYFTNCFLALKVSYANEIYQICTKLNLDYDKVVEYALYDNRIGNTHLSCPGPDGNLGFGGHCFPKDTNALISLSKDLDVKPTVLAASWEKNLEVRKPENRDWEKMKGRAVVDE